MLNPKKIILLVLMFMTIGIAAVTTNVIISGSSNIVKNSDDFLVYFSDVKVNGVPDLSLVKNNKELVFNKEFSFVGKRLEITYDITNASKNYDANITMSCTSSTEYLSIVNDFDISGNLLAASTKTGVLIVTQSKSYTGEDLTQEISCTIDAFAVERTSQGSGSIANPVNPFYVGREVSIGDEKFNIISSDVDSVTMFARYNISNDQPYNQIDQRVWTRFAYFSDWEYISGPNEINIQSFTTEPRAYLNSYVSYLKTEYGVDVTGDLITLKQLGNLGCEVPDDYAFGYGGWTCYNSEYKNWLVNNQYWWTRSANSEELGSVWFMLDDGSFSSNMYYDSGGVRPTITVSKEVAEKLLNVYPVGEEIVIGDEVFNVIRDNVFTVTMLAQKNISDSVPHKQMDDQIWTSFSYYNGWEYQPGPKEVDLQQYEGDAKIILNNYVSYLKSEYDVDATGDLITLSQLKKLGCTIPNNYQTVNISRGDYTCANSEYGDWLNNGQKWWTRSADSNYNSSLWFLYDDGDLFYEYYFNGFGVRPVITVSKKFVS